MWEKQSFCTGAIQVTGTMAPMKVSPALYREPRIYCDFFNGTIASPTPRMRAEFASRRDGGGAATPRFTMASLNTEKEVSSWQTVVKPNAFNSEGYIHSVKHSVVQSVVQSVVVETSVTISGRTSESILFF